MLDITPTLLALYGLPVGEDMDGKVLVRAFEHPPEVATIPSWDDVPGNDGRHPPHTRLDPVASREALEQFVALGYIARPDENNEKAVADTVDELKYNLGEAYQDADRHAEALEIFRELHQRDPDEQRFAVHRFVSCQALELVEEMRTIVEDLDGRRRELFLQAQAKLKEFAEIVRRRVAERKAKVEAENPEAAETAETEGTHATVEAEHASRGSRRLKPRSLWPRLWPSRRPRPKLWRKLRLSERRRRRSRPSPRPSWLRRPYPVPRKPKNPSRS